MARRRSPLRIGPLTNIVREDDGWTVRVRRRGHDFVDYFGDSVWGGRAPALLAAQHFRDGLLQRIGADTRVRRRIPKGSRSKTGVPGVSFERHVVDGHTYSRYIAQWQDPEEGTRRRRFLVQRYGRELARELAIQARRTGVAQSGARLKARQREEARKRLRNTAPMPRPVKDPRSRKGISMARRRPRRKA